MRCAVCWAGVSCYFVWRQLARDGPDSREYGRYHLLLTSRLLLMTAFASLSPLVSSDWSTLRLTCLSLVDIGGGSEAGVVFIRCVDTWHIYRFSSPHSRTQLSPSSELAHCHPPSPDIDINSFYEPRPSSPSRLQLAPADTETVSDLARTRTATGDTRRVGWWESDNNVMQTLQHLIPHCSWTALHCTARLNDLLLI